MGSSPGNCVNRCFDKKQFNFLTISDFQIIFASMENVFAAPRAPNPENSPLTANPNRAPRPKLSVAYLPLDRLKPDPGNARRHSAKQIGQIVRSIESFGFNVPILVD